MKYLTLLCLTILLSATSLFAQGEYSDHIQSEAKRYKTGGIAMIAGGTAMIGGGAAMMYNDSKYSTVMGAAMLAIGVGVDVGSIFMFRKRNQIIDDARSQEEVPLSLIVHPQGVQFSLRF